MFRQLLVIMGFQLAGELITLSLDLPFPGPLCGMVLLLGWLSLRPGLSEELAKTGAMLIEHFGLLFVPAGTAVVAFGGLVLSDGIAIVAAVLSSTALAVVVTGRIAVSRGRARRTSDPLT